MRTLTFLFADLRDYTAFVERHGDVAATTLIADYRRVVRAEVARAKGAEVKTEGDSFYVVFEGAGDAVRCAMSILREADRYSRERPDRPMRVGVGIHAGEPQPHEGQYVGGAVIVAARLAQASAAGELLVSDVVRGLLPKGTAPAMQERQGLVLKGIADAPRAFSVSWTSAEPAPAVEARDTMVEAAAPTDRSMLCPRVIGRESELAALRALLGEAAAGQGRTVLIAGEAGVGKSATLRAFLEHASAANARVVRGECSEVEARRPFGPFIDAFVAASVPVPVELSQGGPGAMAVAEVERYRVHGAFAQALGDLAESGSVVIAIEDVHWADSATLELIPYLARKLRERRILLLYTYRDDEMHRLHPLRGTLAELNRLRIANEIRLARLTADEVAAMIQETMGLGRAPTTAFREAITERCEGNPFFIEEVLRTLVEKGDLEYREGAWRRTKEVADLAIPDSVRDAVQQRLGTLTANARRVLQIAAVIGQRFAFDLLQRVSGTSEASLLDALREAMEAQLVIEEPDGGEEAYRFRHALTRESVLAELMRRERRLLHLEVGVALEGAADADRFAEELAYHFDSGGDNERAFRYHDLAARLAERASSFARSVEHLERAIELAPPGADVGSLQLRLAGGLRWGTDNSKAIRAAEAARASFKAAGQAAREGEALAEVAWLRWRSGETATALEEVEESIRILEPLGVTREFAFAYGRLARMAAVLERTDATDLARRAVALSEDVGRPDERVMALIAFGTALAAKPDATAEDIREGTATMKRAIALAHEHGLAAAADSAYHNIDALLAWSGTPWSEIEANHAERVERARRSGIRTDPLLEREANRAYRHGDWDVALQLIEEGRGDAYFAPGRASVEAAILTARSGPDAARQLATATLSTMARRLSPQDVAGRNSAEGLRLALVGDARVALAALAPLVDVRSRAITVDVGILVAIWAGVRLNDREALGRWAEVGIRRRSAFGHGQADAARAFAEAARAWLDGNGDRVLERSMEAARILERILLPVHATLVRQARSEWLVERGDRVAARAEIEAFLPYWRKAKATWYLGQLREWAAERGIELTDAETAPAS